MQKTQKNPHIQQNNNNRWWYFPLERLQFTFISSSPSIDKSQWNLNKLCILTVKKNSFTSFAHFFCSLLLFLISSLANRKKNCMNFIFHRSIFTWYIWEKIIVYGFIVYTLQTTDYNVQRFSCITHRRIWVK